MLLALPAFLGAYVQGGLSVTERVTDNLYYRPAKTAGNITAVSGHVNIPGSVGFSGIGMASVMAADPATLILGSTASLGRTFFLPGAGNKNDLYAFVQALYPTDVDLYRYFEGGAGDSLGVYIRDRYRWSTAVRHSYRAYASDAARDIHRAEAQSSISLPLPYFFMVPGLAGGIQLYGEERVLFGQPFVCIQAPLRPEFSIEASVRYLTTEVPELVLPVDDTLTSDELFAEANLHRSSDAALAFRYLSFPDRIAVTGRLGAYDRRFFSTGGPDRQDQGLLIGIELRAYARRFVSLSLGYDFRTNRSSDDAHTYTQNGLSIDLAWNW